MRCGDCRYFIPHHGSAGMCVANSQEKVCAPGGCTGLPFKRVFAYEKACGMFRRRD